MLVETDDASAPASVSCFLAWWSSSRGGEWFGRQEVMIPLSLVTGQEKWSFLPFPLFFFYGILVGFQAVCFGLFVETKAVKVRLIVRRSGSNGGSDSD